MPFQIHFNNNQLKIGLWQITESLNELQQLWQGRAAPTAAPENRQKEWLASRLCLQSLLNEACEIVKDSYGKPQLLSGKGQISISHCKGFAAVAYHPIQPVGIDMEYLSDRILTIAPRFVRPEETFLLEEYGEIHGAMLIWSAKESLFKLYGRKSLNFKEHLLIAKRNNGLIGRICKDSTDQTFILNHEWFEQHVLTWVCHENE